MRARTDRHASHSLGCADLGQRDVASPDLACVACNELRPHNPWVTDRLKRLNQYSQFEDVREMANAIHQHYYSVAKSGKLNASGEEVANKEHMEALMKDLLHGLQM